MTAPVNSHPLIKPRRRGRPIRLALGLALLFAMTGTLGASALEYQVKAAYLFNFLRFIDWPEQAFDGADPDFNLCILGHDPFGEDLAPVSSKKARSRSIHLRRIGQNGNLRTCHLLFISQSEASRVAQILRPLSDTHVLTVSDLPHFAADGGVIGFVIDQGKVRLEINLDSARRAGLYVSSDLLEVASEVHRR